MDRCSPVEMRKNLETVEQFKRAGLDFVVIPAKNASHKNELIAQGNEIMEEIIKESE